MRESSFERKHLGSGIYRCGTCGSRMYAIYPHGMNRKLVYACRPTSHAARLAGPLDAFVTGLLLERISTEPDLLPTPGGVDVDELHTRREALVSTKDELATLLREGVLDGHGVRRESAILTGQIAAINTQLADVARRSPVAELIAAGDRLSETWETMSPDLRGKAVEEVLSIMILPAGKRLRSGVVDLDYLDIQWKVD